MPGLLIVDDEPLICQSFNWVFVDQGIDVSTAGSVSEGWQRFQQDRPEVIVLDYRLPDGSGLELYDRIRAVDTRCRVIFLTARGTTETAIEAMKRGAFDYLGKPFDLEQMSILLKRAFESARATPAPVPASPPAVRIVGGSPAIREISKQIGRVAPLEVAVLIQGESGTGKELVARAIHDHSSRASQPFLAINCAAIPEGLVESELFGHELGAFTGAGRQRIGRFEQADGGIVFLDEIGDMPAATQAKILRFLQELTFERVGGESSITTRVRVLAATNQDLDRLIAEGRFRRDLYYRLKEVTIRLPPLRERVEDIPELAQHFLSTFAPEAGKCVNGFASDVLDLFGKYPWPGNVRELRGVIKEATIRATGPTILPEFLPPELFRTSSNDRMSSLTDKGLEIGAAIDEMLRSNQKLLHSRLIGAVEKELIMRLLKHTNGHLGNVCSWLGIDRKTLRNKIRDLGIRLDDEAEDKVE